MDQRTLRHRLFAGVAIVSLGMLTACNPPSESTGNAENLPSDQQALITQAREEGQVSLGAGGHTVSQAQLLADEFEAEYGIKVNFIRENSGQIAQKLEAQMSGGNVSFDVVSLNDTSTLDTWTKEGVLADAEIVNAADIFEPLQVEESIYYPFTWSVLGYSYNSSRTAVGDAPASWDDLAKADGTKAVADPGSSGAALAFAGVMDEIDSSFFPQLGEGEVLTSESALALGQMVATGEASFGIPGIESEVATAQLAGEPIKMGYPAGDLGAMSSYISALSSASSPAAARLLVQFAMSPDFQQAQLEIGSRSTLGDLPAAESTEEIDQERIVVLDQASLVEERERIVKEFEEAIR